MSYEEALLKKVYNVSEIQSGSILNYTNKINRFKMRHPDHELENGFGYIFFTRPDLNLYDESGKLLDQIIKRPEFYDHLRVNPYVFQSLKQNRGGNFINILNNYAENFDVSDEALKTRDTNETSNDWKVMYGGKATESRTANTFSINFTDNRQLDIYRVNSIWFDYIDLISLGYIKPSETNRYKRILDYAASVYFFLTAEDGETIIYYAKYTGVFPLNKPSSAFSWSKGDFKQPQYSIQYQYSFRREMLPTIIKDFNKVSGANQSSYVSSYNPATDKPTSQWVGNAFVQLVGNQYKLRFK